MMLVVGQVVPLALDSIKPITFDNLDAFFDERGQVLSIHGRAHHVLQARDMKITRR